MVIQVVVMMMVVVVVRVMVVVVIVCVCSIAYALTYLPYSYLSASMILTWAYLSLVHRLCRGSRGHRV